MTDDTQFSRRFSKRMTFAAFAGIFGVAGSGMLLGYPDTPGLVRELVIGSAALLLIYMEIGHRDFRVAKGLPGFADLLSGMLARHGRGRGRGESE